MKKGKNLFWGLFFILIAVYVVVSKLGVLPDVGVFKIFLTVAMIGLMIEGIRYLNFYEILFPAAVIGILYDEALGITELTPWTLLAAALFGSIGLSMIFRSRKRSWNKPETGAYFSDTSEQCSGNQIRIENNFGSAIRYINSDNFKSARVENNFGTLTVYFDNAIIQDGMASVEADNSFGEMKLYIPKEWRVEMNLERSFGSVRESGSWIGSSNQTLVINGECSFGSATIYYV